MALHQRLVSLGIAALLLMAPAGNAATSARIVETQPSASATLGHQQSFNVRIAFSSDEAVSLWARPYRNGQQVKQAISNASLTYVGSGEALGWFALTEPGDVDEIRIKAGGGKPYREWEVVRQAVQLRWTAARSAEVPRAEWAEDLLATEKARYAEDARQRAAEPVSDGTTVLFSGFMFFVLALLIGGIGAPLWSVWKWRGGWRIAAAVPAAVMLFVVLRLIVDTARDPTSHNLWPFEILQFGVVALVLIGVLKLVRRIMGVNV